MTRKAIGSLPFHTFNNIYMSVMDDKGRLDLTFK